jgi:cytosine/adenosine deaminase-related metal-dependent hydrolase
MILVHNVNTSREDLEWILTTRDLPELFWCLCPNANLYINGQLPDLDLLQDYNCKIVIGTDSLASNSRLNILEEIKTLQENFPTLSTSDLLKWSTINGAQALRIENIYGSFEAGKSPGIVNITGGKDGLLEGSVAKKVL